MTKITILLDEQEVKILEKRAKKNLFSLREQIEDIVRRSCANTKKGTRPLKIDDRLVGIFSRQRSGRKRIVKKKVKKKTVKKKPKSKKKAKKKVDNNHFILIILKYMF